MTDDLGYGDLGCYGNQLHETPNIDSLATDGIKLTRHYSAGAVCTPTRASVITGNNPARLHVTEVAPWGYDHKWPDKPLACPPDRKLKPGSSYLGHAMKELGYQTGTFGKWHISGVTPEQAGFDSVCCTRAQVPRGLPHKADNVLENDEWRPEAITNAATDFMARSAAGNKPFFAYVSHWLPHVPWGTTRALKEKYDRKIEDGHPAYNGATYAGMIEQIDQSVGRLLEQLNHLGLADHTLVIFTSDNGGIGDTNGALRGGKSQPYEGGIRVPFLARWPGEIAPGTSSDDVVVSTDYYPTLHAISGGVPKQLANRVIDGENVSHVLHGQKKQPRGMFVVHFPHYRKSLNPWSAIIKGQWKYIHAWERDLVPSEAAEGDVHQLYDLANDPNETTNLVDSKAEVTASLKQELLDWLRSNKCQLPVKR